MNGRDMIRYLGALVVISLADFLFFATLGLPRDTNAEILILAVGFTLLCAIRDRDGAEGGDANAAPVPHDRQARAEGIARKDHP